jgi:pSer/pThr/pTyr-binding forkhead associated (FHA) protein
MTKFSKKRFHLACGGEAPLKILLENREAETKNTFLFEQPFILVGQHAAADIRLKHPAVGTRHFLLQLLGGRLFCVQLSNRSPLHWRGKANQWGWIIPEDRIQFGPFALSVLDGLPDSSSEHEMYPNPLMSSPDFIPPVVLEYRSNVARPFRGQVNRALSLLGSSPACKFRIQSNRISSIHCGLVRTANGIWAVDLGGQGGIGVNSVVSRVARLEEGDVFELGDVGFHVHYETPLPEAPPVEIAPTAPVEKIESFALVEEGKSFVSSIVLAKPGELPLLHEREAFERMIGPVLEHFAAFQSQTFQQFQDLLNNTIQLMGSMFREQLDAVREEMRRFDHLSDELANLQKTFATLPEAIAEPPPEAIPVAGAEAESPPKPKFAPPEPRRELNANVADANMHLWLQSQIAELNEQRTTLWRRFMEMVRGKPDPTQT